MSRRRPRLEGTYPSRTYAEGIGPWLDTMPRSLEQLREDAAEVEHLTGVRHEVREDDNGNWTICEVGAL